MKIIFALLVFLVAGCSTTYIVDRRECQEIGSDHLQCSGKGIHKVK